MAEVEGPGPVARKRIAVIGSSYIDLVIQVARLPQDDEPLDARDVAMAPGGKGSNQAVAAARLGGDVLFVTRVGDDRPGRRLLESYRNDGIDVSQVLTVPGASTGTMTTLVEPSGKRRVTIATGANAALTRDAFEGALDALRTCRLLVLQFETPLFPIESAIEWARKADIDVVLNPSPACSSSNLPGISGAFLVTNRDDLSVISGMPTRTIDDVARAANAHVSRGVRAVIVTLGADGALVREKWCQPRLYPAPAVTPRDTTGADDAFVGAFAERWVATGDLAASVDQAVRYATDSTTREGGQASYADASSFTRGAP